MGEKNPGLFAWGDMGMLNYMVHSLSQQDEITTTIIDLQHIPGHHGIEELKARCRNAGWRFPRNIGRPRIGHFCGRKPFLHGCKAYSKPFTIARLEHYRRQHSEVGAWLSILGEEQKVIWEKSRRRLDRFS